MITETRNRAKQLGNGSAVSSSNRRRMTCLGESREEAQGPTRTLVHPKTRTNIGNWNVRTLFQSGNIAIAAKEMKNLNIDILGISETHWTEQGKTKLSSGETIIYSGRDDNMHREGVGILMTEKA